MRTQFQFLFGRLFTYQISLKSKKLFVAGRTYGHLRPTLLCWFGGVDLKYRLVLITRADGSHRGKGFNFLPAFSCLFICMISRKTMQLGSPNLTQKCSTMSPGNPLFCGQNSTGQRSRSRGIKKIKKTVPAWVVALQRVPAFSSSSSS